MLCKHINRSVIKPYQQCKTTYYHRNGAGKAPRLATEQVLIGTMSFHRILLSVLFLKSLVELYDVGKTVAQ